MSDDFDKPSAKTDANDDGFVPGQPVSWEQYSKHRAKARKENIAREQQRPAQRKRKSGVNAAIPKADK